MLTRRASLALQDWTQLAVQKLGEPNGPKSADEALTQEELDWLTEAMQIACYYTPHAERRLQELSPRFVSMETAPLPDKPFPRCVKIGDDGGDSPEHEEAQDGSAGLLGECELFCVSEPEPGPDERGSFAD